MYRLVAGTVFLLMLAVTISIAATGTGVEPGAKNAVTVYLNPG